MTPRPIHRWSGFWLGILILTFLSWAWIRSRTHDDLVRFHPGMGITHGLGHQKPWYILRSTGGNIWWQTQRDTSGASSSSTVDFSSTTSSPSVWFPAPYRHYATTLIARGGDHSFSDTRIAYWLLILLFLLSWAAYLRWRWHRIQHLTKPQPPVRALPLKTEH